MELLSKIIAFKAEAYPIEFLMPKNFQRRVADVLTKEEWEGFLNFISANPDHGNVIPGAHGLRKIRWKAKGFGKAGGARIVYYFRDLNMPLILLSIYAKNEKVRLSEREMHLIERQMKEIIDWFAESAMKRVAANHGRSA